AQLQQESYPPPEPTPTSFIETLRIVRSCTLKHAIYTKDDAPINAKPYRFPAALREELHRQVNEMIETGIVETSESSYRSNIFLVPNHQIKKGIKDMCNNLAQINEIAREKLVAAKLRAKYYYDKKANAINFKVGDSRRREREREEELRRLEREREEARIQAQHTQSIESTESAEGEEPLLRKKRPAPHIPTAPMYPPIRMSMAQLQQESYPPPEPTPTSFIETLRIVRSLFYCPRPRKTEKSQSTISVRGETEADKYVLWGFLFSRHRPVYYFSYTVARKSLFPLCAAAGKLHESCLWQLVLIKQMSVSINRLMMITKQNLEFNKSMLKYLCAVPYGFYYLTRGLDHATNETPRLTLCTRRAPYLFLTVLKYSLLSNARAHDTFLLKFAKKRCENSLMPLWPA
ncbi:unnamed protein product, partial [Trichogramma brassicae]